MSVESKAENLAPSLSESARARLAEKLIASLHSPFSDDDSEGIEEAVRRSREMDANPEMVISYREFVDSFKEYRG